MAVTAGIKPLTERILEARATACAARAAGDEVTASAWDQKVDRLLDSWADTHGSR